MSAGLIKHLKKKTEEDSNTRILMSQWEFDEKLVGKSLENVGSYYPHFSSHNESHSQQILVNIERLLGNNIEKLTATDTWLILEAAYWHDIGMLFNADEVQKVFEEDDFKEYIESLANDNTQDLHEFAKVWHEDGWNKALVNHSDPHTGVEKYRQMVAEWYRRGHAKNSNSVVLDPFEKLGITSPRTELLPKRIYRYLGQICWAHGLGFEDYVMKTLPFRQTGMGTENCHPRFVACLLRLGDLFDIDDNRFCPVMARQVGNMPSFSETHKHKHQAIREFQLDNETVSITAVCNTEMSYIECRNWFNWIREEIQNQMSQWKNIVPSRDFGLLPTINKLDVEMDDSKILINKKPMKFSLDEKSVIELLQGNNLYSGMSDVIRELLQNAIDATLIRVWIDTQKYPEKLSILKDGSPYDSDVIDLIKGYDIQLDIELIEQSDNLENIWKLSIHDCGTGISLEDLRYIQYMGGSNKNLRKTKIVKGMPLWMQPSGTFGIGLHSAFLLNKNLPPRYQHLKFITKNIFDHICLEVKLNSPLGKDNGFCFIKEIEPNLSLDYGTTTELHFKTDVIASSFITNKSVYKDISELSNDIYNTFNRNIPKVIYDKNALEKFEEYQVNIEADKHSIKDIAWLKFKKYNCAAQFFIPDTICDKGEVYYSYHGFRGQDIPSSRETMDILHIARDMSIYLDIYGEAKYFVTINRNDWQYSAIQTVISDIKDVFLKQSLTEQNKHKIVHGFSYNKELGYKIISETILNDSEIVENIEDFMFNGQLSVKDMLKRKIFLTGDKRIKEDITRKICEELSLNSIEAYNKIHNTYYDATINFFIKNGFTVYSISKQSQEYPLWLNDEEIVLFINFNYTKDLEIASLFQEYNIAELPKNQHNELEFVDEKVYFTDTILNLDDRLDLNDITIIGDFYDDYYLFEKISYLRVKIKNNHFFYNFDDESYDEGYIGIIFPFYIEDEQIMLHDLEKLYIYVSKKSVTSNLSINEIKEGYKQLINLVKEITKEKYIWTEFFKNNSIKLSS